MYTSKLDDGIFMVTAGSDGLSRIPPSVKAVNNHVEEKAAGKIEIHVNNNKLA